MDGGEYKAYVMHPQNRRRDLGLPLVVTNKLFAEVALQPNRPAAFFYEVRTKEGSPYKTPDSFVSDLSKMANSVNGFEIDHFDAKLKAFGGINNLDVKEMGPVGYVRQFKQRKVVDGYVGELRVIKRKQRGWRIWNPILISEHTGKSIDSQVSLSYSQAP